MDQKKDLGVRVRFAPSPTGYLHIGNLRAAIFNWLFARHHKGKFLLRIEDTDKERYKKEYVDALLEAMSWMGLDHDQDIVIQSDMAERHKQMIQKLIDEGKAYKCYCAAEEVEERKKEKSGFDDLFSGYDGYCADKDPSEQEEGKPYVVRFKLPSDVESITFDDLVRGPITFNIDQFDDFIIARSDGSPMYNVVVVLDDAYMKISHVIRGEDHISNTPKQIMLYKAFGFDAPQFAHVPLILGPSGDKLSKRDAKVGALEYKKMGYIPDALFNYLVRLGWSHGDQEIFSKNELVSYFDLDHVGKKGAIFDQDKLLWLNGVYMRDMVAKDLRKLIDEDLAIDLQKQCKRWNNEQLLRLLDLYKERTKDLAELVKALELLDAGPTEYDADAVAKWVKQETPEHLQVLLDLLEKQELFEHDKLASAIKERCKEIGVKLVALAQPIRLSLTGTSASPGVFELLELLGKEESINRIKKFLDFIRK